MDGKSTEWWTESGTQSMRRSRRRRTRRVLLRLLIAFGLGLMLLAAPMPTAAQPSSSEPAGVVLSSAEADSIIARMDDLELEVRLREIDLQECRGIAAVDSAIAAERLRLQRESFDRILEGYKGARPSVVERILKHPTVWFALGVWVALRVAP